MNNHISIAHFMKTRTFVFINVLGIVLLISPFLSGAVVEKSYDMIFMGLSTLGSALLAIGISLPAALYFQLRANSEAYSILDACGRSGIRAIYKSRFSEQVRFRDSIDGALAGTKEILLLGIAFHDFFDVNSKYSDHLSDYIENPNIKIKILLLNPRSGSAKMRGDVEHGGVTEFNINKVLDQSLPSVIERRLLNTQEIKSDDSEEVTTKIRNTDTEHLLGLCNFEVKLYETEPSFFMIGLKNSIFIEQYHLGRVDGMSTGSCIGKHMPVVEYDQSSDAAKYLIAHFNHKWSKYDDYTCDVIENLKSRLED